MVLLVHRDIVEIKTKSKAVPYVSKGYLKHTNIAQGSWKPHLPTLINTAIARVGELEPLSPILFSKGMTFRPAIASSSDMAASASDFLLGYLNWSNIHH